MAAFSNISWFKWFNISVIRSHYSMPKHFLLSCTITIAFFLIKALIWYEIYPDQWTSLSDISIAELTQTAHKKCRCSNCVWCVRLRRGDIPVRTLAYLHVATNSRQGHVESHKPICQVAADKRLGQSRGTEINTEAGIMTGSLVPWFHVDRIEISRDRC